MRQREWCHTLDPRPAAGPGATATEATGLSRTESSPPRWWGSEAYATALGVTCLTVLAAVLRLSDLAGRPLVGTETASYIAAQASFVDLVVPPPAHGIFMIPLTYVLQSLCVQLVPGGLGLRLPGLLAGIAAVPLLWVVGRRFFDRPTAWIATLLLATAPMHVFQSQLAKFYPLMVLLGLGTMLCLHRLLGRPDRWAVGGLTLLSLLSLYNQLYAALLVVANLAFAGVFLAARRQHVRPVLRALGLSTAVITLGYLPYLPITWTSIVTNPGVGFGHESTPRLHADLAFVGELLGLYGPGPGWQAWVLGALVLAGVALLAQRGSPSAALLITHVLLPFAAVYAMGTRDAFDAEHLLYVQPVLLLLAAAGIAGLTRVASRLHAWLGPGIAAALCGVLIGASLPALWAYYGLHSLRTYRSTAHLQLASLALEQDRDPELIFHLPGAQRFLETWIITEDERLVQDPDRHWYGRIRMRTKVLERSLPKKATMDALSSWSMTPELERLMRSQPISQAELAGFAHWAGRDLERRRGTLTSLVRRLGEADLRGGVQADAQLSLALEALGSSRWELARHHAEEALAHAPGRPELLVVQGVAMAQSGDPEAARRVLEQALAAMDSLYAYGPQKVDGMSTNYREVASPFEDRRVGYGK